MKGSLNFDRVYQNKTPQSNGGFSSLDWFRIADGIFPLAIFLVYAEHGMDLVGDRLIAKCSEPRAVDSDVMDEGSCVAILSSVRIETWWD